MNVINFFTLRFSRLNGSICQYVSLDRESCRGGGAAGDAGGGGAAGQGSQGGPGRVQLTEGEDRQDPREGEHWRQSSDNEKSLGRPSHKTSYSLTLSLKGQDQIILLKADKIVTS